MGDGGLGNGGLGPHLPTENKIDKGEAGDTRVSRSVLAKDFSMHLPKDKRTILRFDWWKLCKKMRRLAIGTKKKITKHLVAVCWSKPKFAV